MVYHKSSILVVNFKCVVYFVFASDHEVFSVLLHAQISLMDHCINSKLVHALNIATRSLHINYKCLPYLNRLAHSPQNANAMCSYTMGYYAS